MNRQYSIISRMRTGNICNYMLADLSSMENVSFVYEYPHAPRFRNRYLRKIEDICMRLTWLCRKKLIFSKLVRQSYPNHTIIVTNEAMQLLQPADLNKLKKSGMQVTALLIDPVSGNYPSARAAQSLISRFEFAKIITFDPKDAQKYNWTYCNTLYSLFPVKESPLVYDLFYIGNLKDRLEICKQLLSQSEHLGIRSYIKLSCSAETAKELPKDVVLDRYLPYPDMLQLLQHAKCILDITQEGQSGVTLRYYEAVVFNKKLLTNNENITSMPFYNPRYMKVYHAIEEIDWQWVQSDDMPNYGYDNRFSPTHMLELL